MSSVENLHDSNWFLYFLYRTCLKSHDIRLMFGCTAGQNSYGILKQVFLFSDTCRVYFIECYGRGDSKWHSRTNSMIQVAGIQ